MREIAVVRRYGSSTILPLTPSRLRPQFGPYKNHKGAARHGRSANYE
jgi:hypothetical protein